MNLSAIEIGTNSTKMIVAKEIDEHTYEILEKKSEVNRLSKSMYENKRISSDSMDRTINIIGKFLKEIQKYNSELLGIISTSVLRDAVNSHEFIGKVKKLYGYDIEIISGEREAFLSHKACSAHIKDSKQSFTVIDIGGGSTEVIIGNGDCIEQNISIDIGAVRLTEMFVKTDPVSKEDARNIIKYINQKLIQLPNFIPSNTQLIGTGGTVKTIASIFMNIDYQSETSLNGITIDLESINSILNQMCNKTIDERMNIRGLNPKRADVITAGVLILISIMDKYDIDKIKVSSAGVIEGYIQNHISKKILNL